MFIYPFANLQQLTKSPYNNGQFLWQNQPKKLSPLALSQIINYIVSITLIKESLQEIHQRMINSVCQFSPQLTIAYSQLHSISEIDHPYPHKVTRLTIVHCGLVSLEGIEKFTRLVSLNVKFNCIEDAEEIMRIPNRANFTQLCLEGNPIQFYAMCTYFSLKSHGFDNLVLLNNKDYSRWDRKHQHKKAPPLSKITSKMAQIQKQMASTLQRTIKTNISQKQKLLQHLLLHTDSEATSRSASHHEYQQTVSSQQRTPFRQISLSNVNMIKSVKRNTTSPPDKSKMPQLLIEPIEFTNNDGNGHMPLTQPTATFASQKQRECLPFKGKSNYNSVNVVSEVDGDSQEEGYEITYDGGKSGYRGRQSLEAKSAIEMLEKYEDAVQASEDLAIGFQYRYLLTKALTGLKSLKSRNMPRKVSYI